MKKILTIVLGVLGALVVLVIGWALVTPADPDVPDTPDVTVTPTPAQEIRSDIVTKTENVEVTGADTAVYKNDGLEIDIEKSDPEEEEKTAEDTSAGAPVQGTTKDGKSFSGRGSTIYVDSGSKTVKATVVSNTKNKDAGKIAGVVSALTSTSGYSEDNDNWNHDYSTYYIEPADCILYYPSQLKLKKAEEDSSLTFTDPRSSATLTVSLTENEYECMDDVEKEIVNAPDTQVLASGTDWYSVETYSQSGKNKLTMFSLVGLGNKYEVDANLTYEDRYDFVFEELRQLIKLKFVDDGKWVSNAKRDTSGKVVKAVQADPEEYWPKLDPVGEYFDQWECILYYPQAFVKSYTRDNGEEVFTDPKTGAYILFGRYDASGVANRAEMQQNLMNSYSLTESDLEGENGCRGRNDTTFVYAALRDGYGYIAVMVFPQQFAYSYEDAYGVLSVALPGEDVSTTEMQEIYYNPFSCCVTIPLQFNEYKTEGDAHCFKDSFSGLEMRITLDKLVNKADAENVYSMFEVKADDEDVIYGEYYVKWHNSEGAFIGAVGADCSCLIEIPYPNAYSVYENCWDRFGVTFSDEYETEGDKVRAQVNELLTASDPGDMSDPGDTQDKADSTVKGSDPGDMSDPGDTQDKANSTVKGSDPGDMSDPGDTQDKANSTVKGSDPGDMSDPGDTKDKANSTVKGSDPGDMSDAGDTVKTFAMEEKVNSSYEMLMSEDYSVYPELPLAAIQDPVEETCLCGEVNYISYEDSGTTYQQLLGYIDDMYTMGFECLDKPVEEYDTSWLLHCPSGTDGMPAMYMYIDADKEMEYVSVLYFYIDDTLPYRPGVFNMDFDILRPMLKQPFFDEYDHFLEVFFDYGFPDWYDRFTSYYRLSYREGLPVISHTGLDDVETTTDLPVLEFGHLQNGQFVVEHVYYYAEVDGLLMELFSDGTSEVVSD